jgi:hypothetical protein
MIAALVIVCVMFVIGFAGLCAVCIVMQRSHEDQLRENRAERRDLINRVIAKHGLEVAHLDRVQQPSTIERAEREVHDQVGI